MASFRLAPLVLLLVLPAAQAQVMPTSAVEITLSDDGPGTLDPGGNTSVTVSVELTLRNIVCAEDTAVTVDLAVTPMPSVPGLTATLSATSLEYIVAMGAHTGQGFQQTQDATLDVTLASGAAGNATQSYTFTATFGGGSVCTSAGMVPGSEDTAEYSVMAQGQPGMSGGEDGEDDGGGGGGGNGIPGPGLPFLLVGLAALVAFVRRR